MSAKIETNTPRKVGIANPGDRDWTRERFVLCFGAYGATYVMAWGSLEDALEAAADWLEDHAPGHFCDEQVKEGYDEARLNGLGEEAAQEMAEQDTTSVCDGRHYLLSWEWGIALDNPTRAELKAFLAEPR